MRQHVHRGFCLPIAVLVLCGLGSSVTRAQAPPAQAPPAQAPDERGELADAWMDHVLAQQGQRDTLLRVLVAPSATLLGGFLLAAPAWGELTPATDVAFVAGGAGLLTAAVGAWATSDSYDALRWYGGAASLGFMSLGVGLVALCTDDASACAEHPFPRHIGTSLGVINAGMFLSTFLLWTLAPPPSPGALHASLRGLAPERRHARVLAFLQQRERVRRLGTYVTLPWGLALGGSLLVFAHDTTTTGRRALVYSLGGVMLGVVAATTLYELLSPTDSERFTAGERPAR